jgi:hypothetical protein
MSTTESRSLSLNDALQRHFDRILNEVSLEQPWIERKLIVDRKWREQIRYDTYRYGGILREYEPNLQKILGHQRAVVVGEPGSGKSTVAAVAVRRIAAERARTCVPIFGNLRSYRGNFAAVLEQHADSEILEMPGIGRKYVLDAVDEIPRMFLEDAARDLRRLLQRDPQAGLLMTSRQAFYAQHGNDIEVAAPVFHLLDFDEEDLREYSFRRGLAPQLFLQAVEEAEIRIEVGNPFIAKVITERLLQGDTLSNLRSENIAFMIERFLASRHTMTPLRSRRAIQLLAVGMETYARNQLTFEEAIQILTVGLGVSSADAQEVINELGSSILLRTPDGISFQLHTYGEFLAAAELQNQAFDRVKRLAFFDDGTPNDSWLNAISFLAEMNAEVKHYFIRNHPEWMLASSPAAFNEIERTAIVEQIITNVDNSGLFLLSHPTVRPRRVARLMTEKNLGRLIRDLDSTRPEVKGNALVLLGMAKKVNVFSYALPIIKEVGRSDALRYCAIAAALTSEQPELINELIPILNPNDVYYDQLLECIGTLMTEDDLPRVLPLLLTTDTILTSALYHIKELRTRAGVLNALRFLIQNPSVITHIRSDSYLEDLIFSIPEHCDDEVVAQLAELMLTIERNLVYDNGRLERSLIEAIEKTSRQRDICDIVLTYYIQHGGTPHINRVVLGSWIDEHIANSLIQANAVELIQALSGYISPGPVRERLAPYSEGLMQAQDEHRSRYSAEEAQRKAEETERLSSKQQVVLQDPNLLRVLITLNGLGEEMWPELPAERMTWLTDQISRKLVELDLVHSIQRLEGTSWTQPRELQIILRIIDYYALRVTQDDHLVLALRAWPEPAISNYFNRYGFSEAAQCEFERLISQPDQHRSIVDNLIWLLQHTKYNSPRIMDELLRIIQSTHVDPYVQVNAVGVLGDRTAPDDVLVDLARSVNPGVKQAAFNLLIERQHRPTIERELAALIQDPVKLRAGESSDRYDSPYGWIGKIKSHWAWTRLRDLRQQTLKLELPNLCSLVTETMRQIAPQFLPEVLRNQLRDAPERWKSTQKKLAVDYEHQARILAAQQTPFAVVLTKLKTSTSIVALKIWVEGITDLAVFDKLLRELGEDQLANTLDVVGGWPILLSRPRERWIDGCREAIIIMDGDRGRRLGQRRRPLTAEAKRAIDRLEGLPIRLFILERYGIENYFSRRALEAVLQRSLADYMPIPDDIPIGRHLVERSGRFDKLLLIIRRITRIDLFSKRASLYNKSLNQEVAGHLSLADLSGTDLEQILSAVKNRNSELQLS